MFDQVGHLIRESEISGAAEYTLDTTAILPGMYEIILTGRDKERYFTSFVKH